MKQGLEFSGFLVAALAAHVAVFGFNFEDGGLEAQGGDGTGSVMLIATNASLASLADAWETPPEIMDPSEMAPPDQPFSPDAMLNPPAALASNNSVALVPVLPLVPELQEAPPQINTAIAPRPIAEPAKPKVLPPQDRPPRRDNDQPASHEAAASPDEAPSGAGQNETIGNVSAAPVAVAAPVASSDPAALSQWGYAIRASIERRKRYPAGTRAQGTVTLFISVNTNGTLASVAVVRSSGDARLDNASISAVQRARLPAAPAGIVSNTLDFTLPMSFSP